MSDVKKIELMEARFGSAYVNGTKYVFIGKTKHVKYKFPNGDIECLEAPAVCVNDVAVTKVDNNGHKYVPVASVVLQKFGTRKVDFSSLRSE